MDINNERNKEILSFLRASIIDSNEYMTKEDSKHHHHHNLKGNKGLTEALRVAEEEIYQVPKYLMFLTIIIFDSTRRITQ